MSQINVKYDSSSGLGRFRHHTRRLITMFRVGLGAMTKSSTFAGPLYAQIEPVYVCNYKCIFCRDHGNLSKSSKGPVVPSTKFMPLEMAEQLASDLARMGTLTVELIGRGEPLLHPQFARLVEIFRRCGLEVILYTNGVLLSREMARTLVEMGVRTIRLSINAGNAETHRKISGLHHQRNFERILDGAQALVNFRNQTHKQLPFVFYGFVLLQHNFTEAKSAIQHAAQIGLDAVYFKQSMSHDVCCDYAIRDSTAFEVALDDAKAEALRLGIHTNLDLRESLPIEREDYRSASLTVYSRAPCYLPWFFTLITSDGSVHGCCQCALPLGNLTTQSFRDIWKGPSYRQFRLKCKELPKRGVHSIPECECYCCNYAVRNLVIHSLLSFNGTGDIGLKRTKIIKDMIRFKNMMRFKDV